jgi:hypothetical protein
MIQQFLRSRRDDASADLKIDLTKFAGRSLFSFLLV